MLSPPILALSLLQALPVLEALEVLEGPKVGPTAVSKLATKVELEAALAKLQVRGKGKVRLCVERETISLGPGVRLTVAQRCMGA